MAESYRQIAPGDDYYVLLLGLANRSRKALQRGGIPLDHGNFTHHEGVTFKKTVDGTTFTVPMRDIYVTWFKGEPYFDYKPLKHTPEEVAS